MSKFSTLPLKRLLHPTSPGAVSIKGNLDELANDEGFPAYSASGQDVRLLKPQFSGEGIVLSSVGAQCGKCFYASGKWGIVANTQAFFPTKLADARYLFYLVNQQDFWEISGTAQPYVQVPMSMAKAVPAPPLATQRRIVQFLDEKTTQIDGLLKKKQRLLNLLTEKRQAIITQAVTRGIEMNDSIKPGKILNSKYPEKIGGISTFLMRRLKFVCQEPLKYGANASAQYDDPEWPRFVRITDITESGQLKSDTFRSLPLDIAKDYLLEEGDILLARSGSIGRSLIYKPEWGDACFAGYLVRAKLSEKFDPQFVYWSLNTRNYWSWIESTAIRSTIQNISAERYAEYTIPAPPLNIQQQIAQYLDKKTAYIDKLYGLIAQSIDRLMEYRLALITAAVMGQLEELR